MTYLIYGAYGYTGALIVKEAISQGHKPILAGRNPNLTAAIAEKYKLPYEVFSLEETQKLEDALRKVDLVLHCAGPYSKTARPMIKACLQTKTHYIDITGELEVFEYAASKHQAAVEAGIVLLPGAGFDVVPTDCMAAHLHELMPDATELEMGFQSLSKLSRGTALTMTENLDKGGAIRKDGRILVVPNAYKSRNWEINGKSISFVSIPWGDVSTAFHSTGIPNIILYFAAHPKMIQKMKKLNRFRWFMGLGFVQSILQKRVRKNITGPDEKMRESARSMIWGEVTNEKGEKKSALMNTLEGYKLTSMSAVDISAGVLTKGLDPGFYTPSKAFGADYILTMGDTTIEDLS